MGDMMNTTVTTAEPKVLTTKSLGNSKKAVSKTANGKGKRSRESEKEESVKKLKLDEHAVSRPSVPEFEQSPRITGGTLKEYQLQGVCWMRRLFENGLNGILGDVMGLGKTIQTIGLIAHLMDLGVNGPFMVIAPLSTVPNWVREFKKWTPSISVLLYHGNKTERAAMRDTHMKNPGSLEFPVVITSYEIILNDSVHLLKYYWKFIVIDEGHRIKNMNCKLITELKRISSANRLLLTGTPIQVSGLLARLWDVPNRAKTHY